MVGPKQLMLTIVLNRTLKRRWWNLSESWIIVDNLKSSVDRNKSETCLSEWWICLNNLGSAWNLGIFGRSIFWIFEILKHYGTPPQNTDSHPCTRPPSWRTRGSFGDTSGRYSYSYTGSVIACSSWRRIWRLCSITIQLKRVKFYSVRVHISFALHFVYMQLLGTRWSTLVSFLASWLFVVQSPLPWVAPLAWQQS